MFLSVSSVCGREHLELKRTVILVPGTTAGAITRFKSDSCWNSVRCSPIDELRLLVRSMMDRLLGLLSRDRLAREMSAVTRVITTLTYDHITGLTYEH